jgi:hypothetical protein
MEKDEPRLRRPLEKVMGHITDDLNHISHHVGTTMKDLQGKVFWFNGQILQGAQTTWTQIGQALTNPVLVAQEKLTGSFGLIQQEAVNALKMMGFTPAQAQAIVAAELKGGQAAKNAGWAVSARQAGLPAAAPLSPTAPPGLKRERGGLIGGSGLLDTVHTPDGGRAAPGEAWIANRHTMNALSSATLQMYGKTAWQMIRDEQRPHSAPIYALGGIAGDVASGGVGGISRGSSAGWVQSAHPELHAGIAQAVERVLARFPLTITSTTSGGHASGSYHYLGEAADIAGSAGQMYAAAQWIKASGLAGALTEGIHNPNLSVKNQHGVPPSFWGPAVWAEHLNHIHMAVAGALGAGGYIGGGAKGAMAGPISLRAPNLGIPGVQGVMVGQADRLYAAALQRRINQHTGAAGGISAAGWHGGGSSSANMALGHRMMLAAGWGENQWPALAALWNEESGWNAGIANSSSGAYGIPQALPASKMASAGADWRTNPATQIAWGLGYIRSTYGSPAGAWAHERANNWYATGGRVNWAGWNAGGGSFLTNGPTLFGAGEKGEERVSITPAGGGGHTINVSVNNPQLSSSQDIENVAREVAGRILDALDSNAHGGSDRALMGV